MQDIIEQAIDQTVEGSTEDGTDSTLHPASMLACPFCGEAEFDAVGLKIHLLAGHCNEFDAVPVDACEHFDLCY
jgi:hypothetical protein